MTISPAELAKAYALNVRVIHMQTEDLTHADSLIRTPYNINSLNWVVGHIANNRDLVLGLLGDGPLLNEAETAWYERGSEPLASENADCLPLERLLEIIDQGQAIIAERLPALSPEQLAGELTVGKRTTTLGARLHWYYFHDTYHVGQTDLLRQVAGKNDQIIK